MSQVSQAIRGPRGTRVLLELEKDDQRQEFSPIRDEVTIPSITEIARIQTAPTEPALGLIRIQQFQPDTSLEVELAISRLLEEDIQGIIIDLRDNPGGILSEAVDFCSLFLEEGLTVVSTRNRRDNVDSNVEQVKKRALSSTCLWYCSSMATVPVPLKQCPPLSGIMIAEFLSEQDPTENGRYRVSFNFRVAPEEDY